MSKSPAHVGLLASVTVLLIGCTELGLPDWTEVQSTVFPSTTQPDAPIPVSGARTADELDSATDAERAQATSSTTVSRILGRTTATLGTPSEQGFWLKTPLVSRETGGVVRNGDTGKGVSVTLIPIDGPLTGGSRLSLSAMRALGLPLTAIAEVEVALAG